MKNITLNQKNVSLAITALLSVSGLAVALYGKLILKNKIKKIVKFNDEEGTCSFNINDFMKVNIITRTSTKEELINSIANRAFSNGYNFMYDEETEECTLINKIG